MPIAQVATQACMRNNPNMGLMVLFSSKTFHGPTKEIPNFIWHQKFSTIHTALFSSLVRPPSPHRPSTHFLLLAENLDFLSLSPSHAVTSPWNALSFGSECS